METIVRVMPAISPITVAKSIELPHLNIIIYQLFIAKYINIMYFLYLLYSNMITSFFAINKQKKWAEVFFTSAHILNYKL
jgi:hypothetical protein